MPTNSSPGSPRASQSDRPPLNRLFDVLSNPYRRRILTRFVETDRRDREWFTPDEFLADGEDPDRRRPELYHIHLPKLDEVGYIDWDRDTGEIRPGPRYAEVASLVEMLLANREALPGRWH